MLRRKDRTPPRRDADWYTFVGQINELLASGEYDWAYDPLDGIRTTVEHSQKVTEAQRNAVTNIATARGRR